MCLITMRLITMRLITIHLITIHLMSIHHSRESRGVIITGGMTHVAVFKFAR